jgi:hypothetical protein
MRYFEWLAIAVESDFYTLAFYYSQSKYFAGGSRGIYSSTLGIDWSKILNLPDPDIFVNTIDGAENTDYVMAGTNGEDIYASIDLGKTWSVKNNNLTDPYIQKVSINCAVPSEAAAVSWDANVYHTTDFGDNWQDISLGIPEFSVVSGLLYSQSLDTWFMATIVYGFYTFNKTSKVWEDAGLPSIERPMRYCFEFAQSRDKGGSINYEYIVGTSAGLYRLTQNLKSVEEIDATTPPNFDLLQNYTNPFNPSTTIRYQLPEGRNVDLSIYNMTGQKLKTLVSQDQNARTYRPKWDGTNEWGTKVSSGVYLYTLKATHTTLTKISCC